MYVYYIYKNKKTLKMSHNVGIADQQKHTNKVGMITINSSVYNPLTCMSKAGETLQKESRDTLVVLTLVSP